MPQPGIQLAHDQGHKRQHAADDYIIQANRLKQNFGETKALRGVNLNIRRGEVLAIMGPSGSGKSTLLHALAGITPPTSGQVYFNHQRIDNLSDRQRTLLRRSQFGFVFQFSQLVPELTALDNVAVPLLLNGIDKHEAYNKAAHWLHRVGIDGDKQTKLSSQLSGGQVQRVAVARAMIIQPEVLFADEPTGSLDSLNSELIMKMFIKTAKDQGMTVVMVTHEPTIAAYADREIIVRDGQIEGQE